ncbi:TPA: hypothetical protein ACJCWB_000480 [Yersinia enterocolitica]
MLSKEQLEKIADPGPVDVGGAQSPIVTQMAIELLESRAESLSLREQLEAERQRADTLQTERDEFRRRLKLERSILEDTEKQLAELKALPPIGQVISCNGNKTLGWINDAPVGTLLFTAAKPADSVTLPAPANYEDYGPMVSLEKTMAALALCGIEYTVKK